MKCVKFDLNGTMACFRKPETNSSVYLTFTNIHKIALLGILGSIIGLKGYNQNNEKCFPEFYNLLKNLEIAIETPKINKITQLNVFNNSTGIASQQDGGNQIVKENVLVNPHWTIYIKENDSIEFEKIKDYLLNKKCRYIPYLGRNDYFANIENVEIFELQENIEETCVYDTLVNATLKDITQQNKNNNNLFFSIKTSKNFLSVEKLPIKFDENTFHYVYENFILTTDPIKRKENTYYCNGKILQFI